MVKPQLEPMAIYSESDRELTILQSGPMPNNTMDHSETHIRNILERPTLATLVLLIQTRHNNPPEEIWSKLVTILLSWFLQTQNFSTLLPIICFMTLLPDWNITKWPAIMLNIFAFNPLTIRGYLTVDGQFSGVKWNKTSLSLLTQCKDKMAFLMLFDVKLSKDKMVQVDVKGIFVSLV